ncbi:bifunctional SulP family inorganic anion transporter/carbonic anhydrase [Kineosporia sp. NBRC 101731]|uniref:bifunctional SulP family inorganic anion transporter/carbonic anhydrase n=1 Tax=Kineosporia sp. NBRC 101731 TaxID=3032199 RepID=UPI0024A06DDF|nr:bifunctional SulP family inorganic anion transporter/carbonic anhydrase [Kineosporia sp. NBRC 101731]GLY31809.1 carbonic anhydrase [Kineosporia sp. NBRC 101731]
MSKESTSTVTPPTGVPENRVEVTKTTTPQSHWRADTEASLVVFLVALPLSLGIAVASGAPVVAGIIAAVIGGIVCGLIGGAPLQVTGPAAGLTAVVAGLVAEHGWRVTCLITVMAGLVQIGFGLTKVARAALAISPAVVHGMLAGIGLTIVVGQLHVLLGAKSPSSALQSMTQLPGEVIGLHTASALLGLGTIALTLLWPHMVAYLGPLRTVPAPLASVTLMTLASLPFTVERVDLPGNLLSAVQLPELPDTAWVSVGIGVLTVALVASVETLLSAVAVDKMHEGRRADLDRELIGQGSANILSGLAGGLPVTGVIVRSATNVRAGARTKWSAVLHSVWVALFSVVLVSVVMRIPLSVLAGLLVVIGLGLVNLGHLRSAHRHGEAAVWVATLAGVLLLNLLEGVVVGLVVALGFAARRSILAKVEVVSPADEPDGTWRVVLAGTVTFVSLPSLARRLSAVPAGAPVKVELEVDYLDQAASEHLLDWVEEHRRGGGSVSVWEQGAPVLSELISGGKARKARNLDDGSSGSAAPWDHGLVEISSNVPADPGETLDRVRVLDGVGSFHDRLGPRMRGVLHDLREGQSPCTLFITCADSRVVPNLITHSGPGDLFTVRNVGNLVPVRPSDPGDSTVAAVEYAVGVLGVKTIAVCGHSGCGAMRALLEPDGDLGGALPGWLVHAQDSLHRFRDQGGTDDTDRLAQLNVIAQLGHLMEHPLVRSRVEAGSLELVGMFFDIGEAEVRVLEPVTGEFDLPAGV